MKRIKKLLKTLLRHDFLKHFFIGFFLFAGLSVFFESWIALMITATIGLLKEAIWDGLMGRGTPDFRDCLYTWLPGIVMVVLENLN